MNRSRILIAVCSAAKYGERRQACRDTWLTALPAGIIAFFFIGDAPLPTKEDDVVRLPGVPDDYAHLTRKTAAMLRHTATRDDFDYLFKCDDDTYISGERLASIIPESESAVGFVWNNNQRSLSGGAGYLIPRARLSAIANAIDESGFYEDVEVTSAVRKIGLPVIHCPRLQPGQGTPPSWKNDKITSHWCKAADMRAIHARYAMTAEDRRRVARKAEAASIPAGAHPAFEIILHHRHWTDRVKFYVNGLFSRTTTACSGEWDKDESGNIKLQWFDWAAETIRPVPENATHYEFLS